ncbi:MAG: hypothetical protein LBC78_03310 [Oscillospiraceae bacterium]|jgi:predicted RNA-binding Zn-ribbon protein involved in translation (DUF1610 family)|nr:hypothetical protein [Oscillospiraceae bacterium]
MRNKNKIAALFKTLACVVGVLGFIAGFVVGNSLRGIFFGGGAFGLVFTTWISFWVPALLLYALGEIVGLLQDIKDNTAIERRTPPDVKPWSDGAEDTGGAEALKQPPKRPVNAGMELSITAAAGRNFACPACGAMQMPNRSACFKCGAGFNYEQE